MNSAYRAKLIVRLASHMDVVGDCMVSTKPTSILGGYKTIYVEGRTAYVHRIAYELFVGPIAPGLDIDHLCRVRACMNPRHLEPVTRKMNLFRGLSPKSKYATVCIKGHEYTPENTRLYRGGRICRTCRRKTTTAYKERRLALTS